MDKERLNPREILTMIENKQMSSAEGELLLAEWNAKRPSAGLESRAITRPKESGDKDLQKRVESFLKEVLAKEIKLAPSKMNSGDPFEQFGIDSIRIMTLTRELENHFGELSKTLFFEYKSIAELARYFIENHEAKVLAIVGWPEPGVPGTLKQQPEIPSRVQPTIQPVKKRSRFFGRMDQNQKPEYGAGEDIAIIGLAGRYPLAENLAEFWDNLKNGKDCIREIPRERWDYRTSFDKTRKQQGKTYSKWGGFMDGADQFDPLFFNISPVEAEFMDPQERLFLETVWQVLEDAGYTRHRLEKSGVGVFVGVMYGEYQLYGAEETLRGRVMSLSSSYASIANRISYYFNFQGPSIALDTMCSSSLTAIHLACDSIRKGEIDVAVAGGVNLSVHPNKYILLSQGGYVSSDGRCRSFGEGGDGYVPGEGVGAVLLKPLRKAVKDRDQIYAVIKGSSLNHGGKTNGYTVPNPHAQADLIQKSIARSGMDPRTISYVEAHGTGTSLGDPIEINGLVRSFGQYTKDKQFCAIGSVKSNIGHLESAAGIAGITKILLQMKHRQIVPSLHSEKLNPNIHFEESPFFVQQKLTPWRRPVLRQNGVETIYPRRAGISSFGAGGSNAHIVLEESPNPWIIGDPGESSPQLIILSAKNEEQLLAHIHQLIDFIDNTASPAQEPGLDNGQDLQQKIQKVLVETAADILGITSQDLSPSEGFIELGLSPVLFGNLIEAVNQRYSLNLEVTVASETDTLAGLARYIGENCPEMIKAGFEESSGKPNLSGLNTEEPQNSPAVSLADMAYTLQVGREPMEERLAVIATTIEELRETLMGYIRGKTGLANVYRGNVQKTSISMEHLIEGREGEEFIQLLMQDRVLDKLAQLWIAGVAIDWELLERGPATHIVSLPTYPFARERYWVPGTENIWWMPGSVGSIRRLHPLIDSNESTLEEQCYQKVFTGNEPYLTDHRINGDMVLPGAVHLELARAAGNLAYKKSQVAAISDVVWVAPLTSKGGPQTVSIILSPAGDWVDFEIMTGLDSESRNILTRGKIRYQTAASEESALKKIIPADIQKRSLIKRSREECYEFFRNQGIEYGPNMQVIQEICGNQTESLARISLPEELTAEIGDFGIHPVLLDGVFQTVAGIVSGESSPAGLYLPFAVETVEVLGSPRGDNYVYVKSVSPLGQNPGLYQFQIRLTDLEGRVLVKIDNFAVKAFPNRRSDRQQQLDILRKLNQGELNLEDAAQLMGV